MSSHSSVGCGYIATCHTYVCTSNLRISNMSTFQPYAWQILVHNPLLDLHACLLLIYYCTYCWSFGTRSSPRSWHMRVQYGFLEDVFTLYISQAMYVPDCSHVHVKFMRNWVHILSLDGRCVPKTLYKWLMHVYICF